jgi:hypothetical protein
MSKKNKSRWPAPNQQNPARSNAEQGEPLLPTSPISPAQLAANRANSVLSTGPRTEVGLARSSRNAVKHGLTGQTVLLDSDDAAEYEAFINGWFEDLNPIGQVETDLVISIAQTMWRLNRIPGLEEGIFAVGELELAAQFEHHDLAVRPSLIRAAVYLKYEKQLRNLHLQESRLKCRWDKETKLLWELQRERKKDIESAPEESESISDAEFERQLLYGGPYMDKLMARARQFEEQAQRESSNGFEFSNAEKPVPHGSLAVAEAA